MRTLVLTIALLATGSLAYADDPAPEQQASGGDTLDLGSEPDAFNPYNNERHPAWALLPAAAIALVLLHLRKSKPQPKLVKGPQS